MDDADTIYLPMVGEVQVSKLGLPLFTIIIGLVDGFNPCAMWVLLFLLSILVNLKSRWKIIAVAGSFVFVSGLSRTVFVWGFNFCKFFKYILFSAFH